jgi:mannose-1-phosphate guanylyltransferase
MRKDTAAAVCLGALLARKRFGDPVIVTLTADHLIEPVSAFQRALTSAIKEARKTGALYTFGVPPTHPAAGYGYLEVGEPLLDDDGVKHYRLSSFKEKPDEPTAQAYMASGRYLWNSGMFVWTAKAILDELERLVPDHVQYLNQALKNEGSDQWEAALGKAFEQMDKISIDFAVMEKARDVRCAAGRFQWKDVGGWLAVQETLPRDDNGNYVKGRVYALDAANNLVFCEDPEEIAALIGVNDLVVVRAGAKTLIAHKSRLEDVKKVVEGLMGEG